MSGHGSPNFVFIASDASNLIARTWFAALILCLALGKGHVLGQTLESGSESVGSVSVAQNTTEYPLAESPVVFPTAEAAERPSSSDRQLRLRFSWGGGNSQTWKGQISILEGKFSKALSLGLDLDATAAVRQVDETLLISHWSPSNYGGADVTVEGSSATRIQIELTSIENPDLRMVRTIALDDLVSNGLGESIDESGNRLSVVRVPGDQINVMFEREHLVFRPGESFSFQVVPNATRLTGRTANCRIKLSAAQSPDRSGAFSFVASRSTTAKSLAFELDERGSAAPQEVNLEMPTTEGVYNLELELDGNRYASSFGSKRNIVRRRVQLVVLSATPIQPVGSDWQESFSVESSEQLPDSNSAWPQFPRIAGLGGKTAIGNQHRSTVQIQDRPMLQLQPGGWQAIPLSMNQLGQPHIIEIEYLADGETAIGISLLQPDATGQIPSYGFDSGISIPKSLVSPAGGAGTLQRHRLTVWPDTKTPYLLIANRHREANATLGTIRVFSGPERLDQGPAVRNSGSRKRKLMAFYESPLFSENFGVRRELDPDGAQPLDDWQTFYAGADRLIQYLKSNAYRGAFITVASDGSAIYPSQLLNPSPKHDNGVFFSTGQDPIRKDVLEMLFRMFEREGLVLVPALAMTGPLPEVEDLRNSDGQISKFQLVDINGNRPTNTLSERLPVYNPLNPSVQTAVQRIVEELTQRYQSHPAFDGVAVVCRPDTCTLLPGRQWGYDSDTIGQFYQSQSDLDRIPEQWGQVQKVLLGTHRRQWTQWRANRMTNWYRDLAQTVNRSLPEGRLYLAPVDLYHNEEAASTLSPSLHSSAEFEQVMLRLGFEKDLVQTTESSGGPRGSANNIVLLNPHRIAPDQSLSSRRVDLAVEGSRQSQAYFADHAYAGDLFTHRVSWAHFAQLQEQSPFGVQQSALMRLQQMALAGSFSRQRFVQAIKDRDARILVDGGWTLSMGQEDSIREMMRVYTSLPDVRFDDVTSRNHPELSTRPVAVRQYQDQDSTCFYIANASPWEMTVKVALTSGSPAMPLISSMSDQSMLAVNRVPARTTSPMMQVSGNRQLRHVFELDVKVPAYGLMGGRMAANCLINDFDFDLPQDVDKDLRRHVYALQAKLTRSGNPQPMPVLDNSGFEISGRPSMNGWDRGSQSAASVGLVEEADVADGQRPMGLASLRMVNTGQDPVWVRSNVFDTSETGRISISVWLKTDDPSNQPPLRLALEGQTNDGNYYRFGSVGSLSPDPGSNQIESRWKRFAVHFDDLPITGIRNVRVGFDLMGPGQVSVDNVQVFDRWFDENDTKAITQMLASAGPLLSEPATFDRCRRLLIGYWPSFLDQYIELEDVSQPNAEQTGGRDGETTENSGSGNGGPNDRAKTDSLAERSNDRRAPMFRRIRNLVPQRDP